MTPLDNGRGGEQLKLPDPRMERLREHARHEHDKAIRLDCAACMLRYRKVRANAR